MCPDIELCDMLLRKRGNQGESVSSFPIHNLDQASSLVAVQCVAFVMPLVPYLEQHMFKQALRL